MGLRIKASTINKGLWVTVLLSIAVMVGILLWTTEQQTWDHLTHFRWPFIPLILLLGVVRWFTDGMAFVTMAKHGSRSSVKPWRAASIRLEGSLVGNMVPVLVGNFTMHAYLLHKEKLRIHESMAITVLRAILPVFIFILNIPILMFMKGDPTGGKFFNALVKAISLPIVAIVIAMVITLFYPERIKHFAMIIVHWCSHIKIIPRNKLFAVQKRLFREINQFSRIFWTYLRGRKLMLLGATAWLAFSFFIDYILAMCILWGFGIHIPSFWKAIAFQNLIRPIIFFALTPGGVGVYELTYLGFFSLYMPQHLIGISVLIWRMVLTYLPSVAGAFLLLREFKQDTKLKTMLLNEGHVPEEALLDAESEDLENNDFKS
ncbi:flippase-like domain-containing protein [bacterium]|nr:flippase-like domain-containing protein [bacterium]